jgi:outer membrane lipopolysaccharide assembly protein LptE/RlpB
MRARVLASALCLLLAGCGHYELGTSGRLPFTTLYVAPVANKVLLPQAQAILSTHLRTLFEEDGRVTLVDSPAEADATLTVIITDYHREIAAVRENDTGLASKFVLTLGTTCTLRDNRAGKPYFEKRAVSVQEGSYTNNGQPASVAPGDQLQSEYNTLPLLAGAMADKVGHLVLDVW